MPIPIYCLIALCLACFSLGFNFSRKKKEAENKAYFDGVEKGAELMMKKVRDFLSEEEKGA